MNEMRNKTKAFELLRVGQTIYCRCSKVESENNRAFLPADWPGQTLCSPVPQVGMPCAVMAMESAWSVMRENTIPVTITDFSFDSPELSSW